MKRSRLSQILAGVLVNSIYEMKNYPIVLISTVISPLSLLAVITFVSNGALFGTAISRWFNYDFLLKRHSSTIRSFPPKKRL